MYRVARCSDFSAGVLRPVVRAVLAWKKQWEEVGQLTLAKVSLIQMGGCLRPPRPRQLTLATSKASQLLLVGRRIFVLLVPEGSGVSDRAAAAGQADVFPPFARA